MTEYYIGLMSGTSLDGVDAVLVAFDEGGKLAVQGEAFVPFSDVLRAEVLALQPSGYDELDRAARLANTLSDLYTQAVRQVLDHSGLPASAVVAVGCHGQTVRHAPQAGYTLQLVNLARLAEGCGIDVTGDFRSRDIAAGGQGAPLVPAFHHATFASATEGRVILNIGGIANLTCLLPGEAVTGFDTGPGNMLMDAWTLRHLGTPYDASGRWARQGHCLPALLEQLLEEPYFRMKPPKSTGRDLFDLRWLERQLQLFRARHAMDPSPTDVQATLMQLTVQSVSQAIRHHAAAAKAVYVCGGGARNDWLMQGLAEALPGVQLATTQALGLPVHQVEATAFAWLARQFVKRQAGNLPAVTGATGTRLLGALYPA